MKDPTLPRLLRAIRLILLLLLTCGSTSATADVLRIIELTDGSTISGRIVSLEQGIYTIESESLGSLHLPQSDVLSIRSARDTQHETDELPPGFDQDALRDRIMQDPQIMTDIMALQHDRQIQEILSDPAILQNLQSGDIGALTQDPRIIELLNHPRIKLIQDKILGR